MNTAWHDNPDNTQRDALLGSGGDVHELTVAYALDAVDDAERELAEAHLAGCTACTLELASLRETLGDLAEVTAVEPAPASRAAVLAQLAHVEQLAPHEPPARVVAAPVEVAPVGTAAVTAGPADGPVDELALRRARRSQRLLAPLATAAAVLLVAAGGLGITSWKLSSSRDAAREQAAAITQVVAQPDAQTVSVARADAAWSRARVVVSRSKGEAVLVAMSAPAAPAGHTWQLWFMSGGVAHSAGLMGSSTAQRLTGDVGSSTGVAVSLEPAGGSSQPTTTPVATFALPT